MNKVYWSKQQHHDYYYILDIDKIHIEVGSKYNVHTILRHFRNEYMTSLLLICTFLKVDD